MNEYTLNGTSWRNLNRLGTASAAASVGSLAGSRVHATTPNARGGARFLLDCHVHVGGRAGASPALQQQIRQVKSPKDWLALRGKHPEDFAKLLSQPMVDNSDVLLAKMDEYGVTHALIQTSPGRDASNQRVAEAAKKHKGKLFSLYRPESGMGNLGAGTLIRPSDKETLRQNTRRIAAEIEGELRALNMVGVGELPVGGVVSAAFNPIEIARDMGPIMEALRPYKLPIQLPTATSGWKGGLSFIYEPLWVDELAGNFPDIPIVLTKMGRGIRTSFDACTVVAMRNANVYFDLSDSRPEHLREAVDRIGAQRIMFGTDLHSISQNYAYDLGFHIVDGADLNEQEWEWIAWQTADTVYRLGLGG